MIKFILQITLILTTFIGCAQLKPSPEFKSKNLSIGDLNNFYVNLKHHDGHYDFEEINTKANSTFNVRVNDFKPVGYSLKRKESGRHFFGIYSSKTYGEFETESFAYDQKAQYIAGLVSFGFLSPFLVVFTYVDFDYSKYEKAINEAQKNTPLEREKFYAAYKDYDNQIKSFNNELREFSNTKNRELTSLAANEFDTYKIKYDYLQKHIKFHIVDKSGFYNKKFKNPKDLLSFSKDAISYELLGFEKIKLDNTIFPMPIKDYSSIISQAKTKAKSNFQVQKNAILSNYDLIKKDIKYKYQHANYYIKFDEQQKTDNFHFTLTGAQEVQTNIPNNLNYNLTITGKDFFNIYPSYSNESKDIKIVYSHGSMKFINKTNQYLLLKTISMYYNKLIKNFSSGGEEDMLFELSPKTSITVDLIVPSTHPIYQEANYINLTKKVAKKTNINFGFSIKYRLDDRNRDTTLYKEKKYNLFHLIQKANK